MIVRYKFSKRHLLILALATVLGGFNFLCPMEAEARTKVLTLESPQFLGNVFFMSESSVMHEVMYSGSAGENYGSRYFIEVEPTAIGRILEGNPRPNLHRGGQALVKLPSEGEVLIQLCDFDQGTNCIRDHYGKPYKTYGQGREPVTYINYQEFLGPNADVIVSLPASMVAKRRKHRGEKYILADIRPEQTEHCVVAEFKKGETEGVPRELLVELEIVECPQDRNQISQFHGPLVAPKDGSKWKKVKCRGEKYDFCIRSGALIEVDSSLIPREAPYNGVGRILLSPSFWDNPAEILIAESEQANSFGRGRHIGGTYRAIGPVGTATAFPPKWIYNRSELTRYNKLNPLNRVSRAKPAIVSFVIAGVGDKPPQTFKNPDWTNLYDAETGDLYEGGYRYDKENDQYVATDGTNRVLRAEKISMGATYYDAGFTQAVVLEVTWDDYQKLLEGEVEEVQAYPQFFSRGGFARKTFDNYVIDAKGSHQNSIRRSLRGLTDRGQDSSAALLRKYVDHLASLAGEIRVKRVDDPDQEDREAELVIYHAK